MSNIAQNNTIQFLLGYKSTEIKFSDDLPPTTTLLQFLRADHNHKGTKEGCNVGDCGACTIVIAEIKNNRLSYQACNACLIFMPQIHGKQIITVEHLANQNQLHPVQSAMVEMGASQCGFCTPGFVMSLFGLYKNKSSINKEDILEAFAGNLCRCTGYQPIIEAAQKAFDIKTNDHFDENENTTIQKLLQINTESKVIKTKSHHYYQPSNLTDALAIKADLPHSIIISGATDVSLRVTKTHENISPILDLSKLNTLEYLRQSNSNIHIGSLTSLQSMKNAINEYYPAFSSLLTFFGSLQIRNKSTLAGNIGSASPIGDTLPFLMAIDASIMVQSLKNKRILKIREFITGYHQTLIEPNELISEIILPLPTSTNIIDTYKISKRKDLDISTVSIAVNLQLNAENKVSQIDIYYGGMSAFTQRAVHVCKQIKGKFWTKVNVQQAALELSKDFSPITDARATAQGRLIMAQNLFLKFWIEHH